MLTLAYVVIASQLLGTIGLFFLLPVVVTFAAGGVAAWFLAGRRASVSARGSRIRTPHNRARRHRIAPAGSGAGSRLVGRSGRCRVDDPNCRFLPLRHEQHGHALVSPSHLAALLRNRDRLLTFTMSMQDR